MKHSRGSSCAPAAATWWIITGEDTWHLLNDHGAAHYVLRDCSGKIPCYALTHGSITIVASNIEDLSGLAVPRFSINVRYLAGFIYDAELSHSECGFNEVGDLGGRLLELNGAGARQFPLWDPRSIGRDPAVEDFDDACGQVRQVTPGMRRLLGIQIRSYRASVIRRARLVRDFGVSHALCLSAPGDLPTSGIGRCGRQ